MDKFELSTLIRSERLKQGLTIKKLAELANVTERAIMYWEAGKKKMTIENADKVLTALGISMVIGKQS